MTVRVGVIGTGNIGRDHIRRLTGAVAGARVTAVTDVDAERARATAAEVPGARALATGQEVIADPAVDAVMVTSWGPTHEEYVLASIAAGKPVFCEKPLATTAEACLRIVEAETAFGRRLVQVGFMRRYDDGYRAMKQAIEAGDIGTPLVVHCVHRNASSPLAGFTADMAITDSAVHEIDIVRWLLGDEIAEAAVLTPRRSRQAPEGLQDPHIILLRTRKGAHIDIEVYVNCAYGYDIRCEVVGETGTVELADTSAVTVRRAGLRAGRVPQDWIERFARAYDAEIQRWVDSVTAGEATGPSSWDGYAAAVVSDACLEAKTSGRKATVTLKDKPALYR